MDDSTVTQNVKNLLARWWPIVAFLFCFAALAWSVLEVHSISDERAEVVREGQIENCQIVAVPLQKAAIDSLGTQNEVLRQEIEDNKNIPPEFFPNIPPKQFKQLLQREAESNRRTIEENKQTVAQLSGLPPCEERYPPLP
jgi:hypothetical protein